jgi:quinol monooxygenase YgiN
MAVSASEGVVHIPWYATFFRGDKLEAALSEISAIALRYGATDYSVHRSRDDRYRFVQIVAFPDKASWERYWYGEEFTRWREETIGWWQKPILYEWFDRTAVGALNLREAGNGSPLTAA